MRVLCNAGNESLEVLEIIDLFYDEELPGLAMQTADDVWCHISEISCIECNNICREILRLGYYDLSEYAEYEIDDN